MINNDSILENNENEHTIKEETVENNSIIEDESTESDKKINQDQDDVAIITEEVIQEEKEDSLVVGFVVKAQAEAPPSCEVDDKCPKVFTLNSKGENNF